jgi:hypothetical protein
MKTSVARETGAASTRRTTSASVHLSLYTGIKTESFRNATVSEDLRSIAPSVPGTCGERLLANPSLSRLGLPAWLSQQTDGEPSGLKMPDIAIGNPFPEEDKSSQSRADF